MSIGTAAYGQGWDAPRLAHGLAKISWLNAATVLRSQLDPRSAVPVIETIWESFRLWRFDSTFLICKESINE
jgi:hypothetical protein